MLAAVVEEIAARLLGERMHEQLALCVPGRDDTAHRLEVLLRRLVAPRVAAGIERLQTQRRAGDVTRDAACVAGALGGEDWLHARLEEIEVEPRRRRLRGGRRDRCQDEGSDGRVRRFYVRPGRYKSTSARSRVMRPSPTMCSRSGMNASIFSGASTISTTIGRSYDSSSSLAV